MESKNYSLLSAFTRKASVYQRIFFAVLSWYFVYREYCLHGHNVHIEENMVSKY